MIDHLSLQCRDLTASTAFYDAVFATLGFRRVMEYGVAIGYGVDFPTFWLGPLPEDLGEREAHIAFQAPSREAVDAFHAAALGMGAEVLHEPRVWPEYHPGYYGAFVRDPDGHNVEAVHHTFKA